MGRKSFANLGGNTKRPMVETGRAPSPPRSVMPLTSETRQAASLPLAYLGQQLNPIERGRYPDALAVPLFHSNNGGLAQCPPAGTHSQVGGQHDHEFQLRACLHPRLGIEKNAVRTEVAGQARRLGSIRFSYFDGRLHRHATAGPSLRSLGSHRFAPAVYLVLLPNWSRINVLPLVRAAKPLVSPCARR